MLDRLPTYISPLRFAEKGQKIIGTIQLNVLERLADLLIDHSGDVEIDFSFSKEGRESVLVGHIKVKLVLQCQACMKPVIQVIDKSFKLGLVTSVEQADRLPNDCEPLILENEKILLNELVEDELLLILPDYPRHQENCFENGWSDKTDTDTSSNFNNPFAVLAKLKNIGD